MVPTVVQAARGTYFSNQGINSGGDGGGTAVGGGYAEYGGAGDGSAGQSG
jgi:hypothetical protein